MSQTPVMVSFEKWYADLPTQKRYEGRPAKGVIAAALVVLEQLRTQCDLSFQSHLAPGGAQISGLTPSALDKILARFGENRKWLGEAGRTNRGNNVLISQLLDSLAQSGFATMNPDEQSETIDEMQKCLIDTLDAYFRIKPLRFDYNSHTPIKEFIHCILEEAQHRDQAGAVAQHLVGAKLAMRFPDQTIANFPFSAADEPSGRTGDFEIGNTAFHVTIAPNSQHICKCRENLQNGLNVFLIVSRAKSSNAAALIEDQKLTGQIAVESIESFVGQNVSELAEFNSRQMGQTLLKLLNEYNRRVGEAENDNSLCIDIPAAIKNNNE